MGLRSPAPDSQGAGPGWLVSSGWVSVWLQRWASGLPGHGEDLTGLLEGKAVSQVSGKDARGTVCGQEVQRGWPHPQGACSVQAWSPSAQKRPLRLLTTWPSTGRRP